MEEQCPKCNGKGKRRVRFGGTFIEETDMWECDECKGTGKIQSNLPDAYVHRPSEKKPFVSASCKGEVCFCGKPAVKKVAAEIMHDDPNPYQHGASCYICEEHFNMIMYPWKEKDADDNSNKT